ncbi:unnamed protein product, partial [Effrenium voratum]
MPPWSPLDVLATATTAWELPLPASGLRGLCKAELRPGDHVYAWKIGWTYNHHGIVVQTQPCPEDCLHDQLACCSIVRFKPPGDEPGRIELCCLTSFAQGRDVYRCRYGVSHSDYLINRSGTCSTHPEDPRPLTVLRALSVVDIGDGMASEVEYDLLVKNSELLARWCKLGLASGVRRFLSDETARSLQTSHGRFIRLGLATVATGAAGAAIWTLSAGAAGATAGAAGATAGAASATAGAASATTSATAGATAVTAAGATGGTTAGTTGTFTGGTLSASLAMGEALACASLGLKRAARALVLDAASRPQHAQTVLLQARDATASSGWQHLLFPPPTPGHDLEQQKQFFVACVAVCLYELLGRHHSLHPVLGCPNS